MAHGTQSICKLAFSWPGELGACHKIEKQYNYAIVCFSLKHSKKSSDLAVSLCLHHTAAYTPEKCASGTGGIFDHLVVSMVIIEATMEVPPEPASLHEQQVKVQVEAMA